MIKVIRVITRLNIGGPAQHAILLTSVLGGRGWDSHLAAGQIDPHEGDMGDLASRYNVSPLVIPSLRNSARPPADLASLFRLYRVFRRERPDIVHLHLLKARVLGGLAAWLARVPIVVETFHGTLFADYYRPLASRVLVRAERLLGRLMDAVICVSDEVAAEIIKFRIADPRRVHVIPLGLDLNRFVTNSTKGILRRELGLPNTVPLVGTVGRLVSIKGLAYFVEAAAHIVRAIPGVRFVIIGDGPERLKLERRVKELSLQEQVSFVGWRRDLAATYSDLDVVVLSSLNEGTPVAMIEAMAAGRAVVATRVGGVPDVVEDGVTGVLVPARDPQALAEGVVALLSDSDRRHRLGEAARQGVVSRFTVDRLTCDIEALYRRLLIGKGLVASQT